MKRRTLLSACSVAAFCLILFGKALSSASDGKSQRLAGDPVPAAKRVVVHAAGRGNPYINFEDGIEMPASYEGATEMQSVLKQNLAEPRALASADFDEDGVPDLICGYARAGGGIITLARGNVDSIYENSPEAQQRKAEGTFPDSPFLSPARVFEAPIAADFVGAGDFDADGHWDVVIASRGGKELYLLPGDGKGSFLSARKIALPGAVTSLITGEINRADGLTDVVVGVVADDTPKVLIFEGPEGALRANPEIFSLPGEPRALALGQFDDDYPMDLAVGAGSELVIIHGRDRKLSLDEAMRAEAPQAKVDRRPFAFEIRSIATGDFAGTHETSLALLDRDGTVCLANARALQIDHKLLKKGNPYDVQVMGRWEGARQLVCARVSAGPADNLVLLNDETNELQIPQTGVPGTLATSLSPAVRVVASLNTAGKPLVALPMRISSDALSDLVILQAGRSNPAVVKTGAAVTFTVINTTDGGTGSLRQAILDANANPGSDIIAFNIPGAGAHTITPGTALPDVTESVTIDGTTQPGFVGAPLIELDGSSTKFENGLTLHASNCVIREMAIGRFGAGIACFSDGNRIEGNFIGTDVTGTGEAGNNSAGVFVDGSNNVIGGTATAAHNLVSGNINRGIDIGAGTLNQVQGNLIGTDVTGLMALGNGFQGVLVGGMVNVIGGTTAGSRNVISANAVRGVEITSDATGNLVQGNFIGTDLIGSAIMPFYSQEGMVTFAAVDNTIGGTTPGARNIISGNVPGVLLGFLSEGNRVQGNFIGTDVTGTQSLPNIFDGIDINGPNNTVGGAIPGARNVISGNGGNGVFIFASVATGNQLQGNFIGTDVNGASKLANTANGVAILTPNNVIGGMTAGARNVISGNGQNGIAIQGNSGSFGDIIPGAPGNLIVGNFLGTDVTGNAKLGNGFSGVQLFTPNNIIGGTTVESHNLLSGNSVGVTIIGDSAQGNQILGNLIGTDARGVFALGNIADGIELLASNNFIGGTAPGTRNVISGNDNNGILIAGGNAIASSTSGNLIQGNFIGTDSSGAFPLGNGRAGVFILAIDNLVGGNASSASNRIAFNGGAGINVCNFNGSATGNILSRNSIFSNGGLGIDLGPPSSVGFSDGVTPNDPCDADSGPNNLQNFPVLTSATTSGFSVTIQGTLNSTPSATFTVEFFANTACDTSSFGEGQTFIGSAMVTTATNCGASFSISLPAVVPVGQLITATATDSTGNTSEFSQCLQVQPSPFDLCLQDESNGNILLINSTTGEYQFTNCTGLTVSGIGSLLTKGCLVTLQVNGPDRRILARIDTCSKTGIASIQLLTQGTSFSILDRNTANNTCACTGPG